MIGLKAHIPAAQALECSNYKPERLDLNIKLQIFFTIHTIPRNSVKKKVKRVARLGLLLTGCLSRCPAKIGQEPLSSPVIKNKLRLK